MPPLIRVDDDGEVLRCVLGNGEGEPTTQTIPAAWHGRTGALSAAAKRSYFLRDFDFQSNAPLVAFLGGGVGDFVVSIEVLRALRGRLAAAAVPRRIYGVVSEHRGFTPASAQNLVRWSGALEDIVFLQGDPLVEFDSGEVVKVARTRWRDVDVDPIALDATPWSHQVDYLGWGSAWDLMWARWGLPGTFSPTPFGAADWQVPDDAGTALLTQLGITRPYAVLCPDSVSGAHRKAWSASSWKDLIDGLLTQTDLDILMVSERWSSVDTAFGRLHSIKPTAVPTLDLMTMMGLLRGAACTVALDSGPALLAGLSGKGAVVLWGPTSPLFYGHRLNRNVRLSTCPPCMFRPRSTLCADNVCMQEISADLVLEAVLQEAESGLEN